MVIFLLQMFLHNAATSFDGITFLPPSPVTFSGGVIRVYGMKNA
jgi:hypothetical protein